MVFNPDYTAAMGITGRTRSCIHNGRSLLDSGYYSTTWYRNETAYCYRRWREATGRLRWKTIPLMIPRLVYHTNVGKEITTSSTSRNTGGRLELVTTRITEEWENYLYSCDTTDRSTSNPEIFLINFNVSDSSRTYEDPARFGVCDGRILWPGHGLKIALCVPINMSMPSNGHLSYS